MTFFKENWTKLWSIRLAALAGALSGFFIAFPEQREALLSLVPDGPLRTLVAFVIAFIVFAVPTTARLAKQKMPDDEDVS